MTEVTIQFAIDYLLDDCQDCIENKNGECMTQSHCFEVKRLAIKALKQYGALQEIRQEIADRYENGGLCFNSLKFALESIDKHIKEIEG